MLPAPDADYLTYEALLIGATPAIRVVFLPYYWSVGVNNNGVFFNTFFVDPDRIEVEYKPCDASWLSPIIESLTQVEDSEAVISWTWNFPAFEAGLYWRYGTTEAELAAAGWTLLTNDQTLTIPSFYQFFLDLIGLRVWAIDSEADVDEFNAYALDASSEPSVSPSASPSLSSSVPPSYPSESLSVSPSASPSSSISPSKSPSTPVSSASPSASPSGSPSKSPSSSPSASPSSSISPSKSPSVSPSPSASPSASASPSVSPSNSYSISVSPSKSPSPSPESSYQGYAGDGSEPTNYLQGMSILGEYIAVNDIESIGSLTVEAPAKFDDLVAGQHDGLVMSDRQKSQDIVDGQIITSPAPFYSPNKSSFIFASDDQWYGKQLKIQLGWEKGGVLEAPFIEDTFYKRSFTAFRTLFWGKITKWGPVDRSVDKDGKFSPETAQIYARDFISETLQKRIALPAADGTPQPITYGEFLCEGEAVSGWSPVTPVKTAYFEGGNFNEVSRLEISGGTISLISGMTGSYAAETAVTDANHKALCKIDFSTTTGELFISGNLKFTAIPDTLASKNFTFLSFAGAGDTILEYITVESDGSLFSYNLNKVADFNILGYQDVIIPFAFWFRSDASRGDIKLWMNGDEVVNFSGALPTTPVSVWFGAQNGATAEGWTVVFDNIEIRNKYYKDAFRVHGAPFVSIGPVYIDNILQPETKTVGAYTQTVTRYPDYGIVQFTSTDPEFEAEGDVMIRVVERVGGIHPIDIIEELFELAGLTDYIDTISFTAARTAVPNDICHARFEGGSDPIEIADLGITISECLKEVCARFLYWIFIDAGNIKLVPYTGITPTTSVKDFDESSLYACRQVIDMESMVDWISAVYGWYDRNPGLSYTTGNITAGGQGEGLDYTWNGPVACESYDVVKAKADLLLKYLSPIELLDPVATSLASARIELMDSVGCQDELLHDSKGYYWIGRKIINLDVPRSVEFQLLKFLGE